MIINAHQQALMFMNAAFMIVNGVWCSSMAVNKPPHIDIIPLVP